MPRPRPGPGDAGGEDLPRLVSCKFKYCKALGIRKGFRIWDHWFGFQV
jgi:hypothetical protein